MSNIERRADQFITWMVDSNTAQDIINHLNNHIYPDIQSLNSKKRKKHKVSEDNHYFIFIPTSIPRIRDFIAILKIIYGPNANKYKVKCTQGLRPVIDDFFGPPNTPPIKW